MVLRQSSGMTLSSFFPTQGSTRASRALTKIDFRET